MKKIFIRFLICFLLCTSFFLPACGEEKPPAPDKDNKETPGEDIMNDDDKINPPEIDNPYPGSFEGEEPDWEALGIGRGEIYRPTIRYMEVKFYEADTAYAELLAYLLSEEADGGIRAVEALHEYTGWYPKVPGRFRRFVETVRERQAVWIPCYDGKVIPFINDKNYQKICINSAMVWETPEIAYVCSFRADSSDFSPITTYYIEKEWAEKGKSEGVSAMFDQYCPGAPTVSNWQLDKNNKIIYERDLKLRGETVKAMFRERKDDIRISVSFVYDNILVQIRANPDLITDEWFANFHLEEYRG
jgi:hypothetical protein